MIVFGQGFAIVTVNGRLGADKVWTGVETAVKLRFIVFPINNWFDVRTLI